MLPAMLAMTEVNTNTFNLYWGIFTPMLRLATSLSLKDLMARPVRDPMRLVMNQRVSRQSVQARK